MFTVMGVTGQVGGAIARALLADGKQVRAVVRDPIKAAVWKERGCELSVADVNDADALASSFKDAEGVFVMLPPTFDPSPGFPEARQAIAALHRALNVAKPARVVVLSTIGAQVTRPNLLNQLHLLEESLATLPLPIAFLRPTWFIENVSWEVAPARATGVIPSFLHPLDKPFPMIATQDIGQAAAGLLTQTKTWTGQQIVQLEGPTRISPNDIAAAFATLLNKDVSTQVVPHDTWESTFRAQGMKNPTPRIQMLDGFNEGWIDFDGESPIQKTQTTLIEALRSLL
jgi:uncharacterized protein YbjT (DUF2867 family)